MNVTREHTRKLVACPTCGAEKGDACFQRKGRNKRRASNHYSRQVAAQKIAQGKEAKAKPSKKAQSAKSDGFYSNWKWKKARYEAIKKYEQRCMCCGWQVGDTPHGYLVVDHIKPRSKYPNLELDVNNLQVLCNDCNMGKSNDSCDDWRSMNERFRSTIWL